MLPGSPLSVNSFGKRRQSAYLTAFEELRAEVSMYAGAAGLPEQPFARCTLTIICYSRPGRRGVGRYRPGAVHTLWFVLDPIYRALLDVGIIQNMRAIYAMRTVVAHGAEFEGFRIRVTELAEVEGD